MSEKLRAKPSNAEIPDFDALEAAIRRIGPKQKEKIQFNGREFECDIDVKNGAVTVKLSLGDFKYTYETGREPTILFSGRYLPKHDFDPIGGCGEKDKNILINRITRALNVQWPISQDAVVQKIKDIKHEELLNSASEK